MIVEDKILSTSNLKNVSLKNLYLSLLSEGKTIYINAWGWSMFPFIKNGDRLKIDPIVDKGIGIGDIVAVDMKKEDGPWFFVHRIVKISLADKQTIYITKGDCGGNGHDKPVTQNLISGKVTGIERKNIIINLELTCWKALNRIIAEISFKKPKLLKVLLRYLCLLIEWRWLLPKIINKINQRNPLIYNTEGLLLVCIRSDLDKGLIAKAANFIKEGIEWEKFTDTAIRNGFSLTVYSLLTNMLSYAVVPESVLNKLKSCCLNTLAKSYLQHKQALGILGIFEREKIFAIPLKGAFLSLRLYGEIAKRGASVDFDILVRPKDAEKAIALIQENGYSMDPEHTYIDLKRGAYSFTKQDSCVLDLHWEINLIFNSEQRMENFFKNSRLVRHEDISYYELGEEELLLYLCFHATRSSRTINIKYLRDTLQLLNKSNGILRWDTVIKKARDYRLIAPLYISLLHIKKLFGFQLPDNILRKIRPSWPKGIFIQLFFNREAFFTGSERKILNNSLVSHFFLELMECRAAKEYFVVLKRVFFGHGSFIVRISNLFKNIVLQQ
jgi:hypothetical protein